MGGTDQRSLVSVFQFWKPDQNTDVRAWPPMAILPRPLLRRARHSGRNATRAAWPVREAPAAPRRRDRGSLVCSDTSAPFASASDASSFRSRRRRGAARRDWHPMGGRTLATGRPISRCPAVLVFVDVQLYLIFISCQASFLTGHWIMLGASSPVDTFSFWPSRPGGPQRLIGRRAPGSQAPPFGFFAVISTHPETHGASRQCYH